MVRGEEGEEGRDVCTRHNNGIADSLSNTQYVKLLSFPGDPNAENQLPNTGEVYYTTSEPTFTSRNQLVVHVATLCFSHIQDTTISKKFLRETKELSGH